MKFGILEVGSTNTKAYIYDNGDLVNFGSKYIEFKNNYEKGKGISESDINELYSFVYEIKKEVNNIYIFGTSIFRKISEQERKELINRFNNDLGIDFKVVSADEESMYTVNGVINDIDYNGKMAVVIGGGGSTEIAIIDNKKVINKVNLDFGAMDITNKFPELKEDIVETSFDDILNYTEELVGNINDSTDILVLAGGDYIYFYEKANYEMKDNFIYKDEKQPYLLDFNILNEYDKDILKKSLDKIKYENPDNVKWWDGARGMRFCMNAVARKLDSKYIIPTRINMLIGIANEIKSKY